MKSRFIPILLSLVLCSSVFAETKDIDAELADLATKLAASIKEQGKKKVTVIDFTDLQGATDELGKYIAEQLTVNLVMERHGFSVLDRANLKSILAEHKLTATGLVDPENAKKLGQFAGVDALILGTVVPKNTTVGITAKIIATDTAEIVGAAKGEFKIPEPEESAQQSGGSKLKVGQAPSKTIIKKLGDLQAELEPLQVVNGRGYILTMTLSNPSQKSLWVALKSFGPGTMPTILTTPDQSEFQTFYADVTGVQTSPLDDQNKFFKATEIAPGQSITTTIKFARGNGLSSAGQCRLQTEILVGRDFRNGVGTATSHNLVTQIEAK